MGLLDIIAGPILKIIDKVVPDPQAKAAAQLELARLAASGELAHLDAEVKLALSQTDTNKAEAANPNVFVSGWRPFVGWVCGTGMALAFVVGPLFTWISSLLGHPTPFPSLDTGTLMTCLMGMLGLGGMRTYEKLNGVARS